MLDSTPWLQKVSHKLAANSFAPLSSALYQPLGFKYGARRSGFEISKFGMADNVFMFAEIPNLTGESLGAFSNGAFQFANSNKSVPLPNGFFMTVFCYAVAITENLNPQIAQSIKQTPPVKHWAAQQLTVVYDLANGSLSYFEGTPIWGAAYFAGFRRRIQENLG